MRLTADQLFAVMALFAAGLCAAAWAMTTGNPLNYVSVTVPAGQRLYVASKVFGLVAMTLFWLQALAGLARRTPVLREWFALSYRGHRNVGIATMAMLAVHVGLFFGAVSLRSGHLAWHVLIPDLTAHYFKFYVSVGVIAFAVMLAVVAAGWLRRRRSIWRWLHRAWMVVFGLGAWHALSLGTETRNAVVFSLYIAMITTVVMAVLAWLVLGRGGHSWREATNQS